MRTGLAVVVGADVATGLVAGLGAVARVEVAPVFLTAALVTVFFSAGLDALRVDFAGILFAGLLAMVLIAFFGAALRAELVGFFFTAVLEMVLVAFFGAAFAVELTRAFFKDLAGALRAVLAAGEVLALRSVFFALPLREGFADAIVLRLRGAAVFLLAMICSSGCVRPVSRDGESDATLGMSRRIDSTRKVDPP